MLQISFLLAGLKTCPPLNLRMQAQTAARYMYEDILAHVTLTGAGSRDSRLFQYGTRPEYGTEGLATPETGGRLRAPPQQADRR